MRWQKTWELRYFGLHKTYTVLNTVQCAVKPQQGHKINRLPLAKTAVQVNTCSCLILLLTWLSFNSNKHLSKGFNGITINASQWQGEMLMVCTWYDMYILPVIMLLLEWAPTTFVWWRWYGKFPGYSRIETNREPTVKKHFYMLWPISHWNIFCLFYIWNLSSVEML